MNRLVIAEKPSVGKAIAAVLGAHGREDGCFIGNGYIVSWCFGHLAELAAADTYDEKYGKWRYLEMKKHYQDEIQRGQARVEDLERQKAMYIRQSLQNPWLDTCSKFTGAAELTEEMAHALIERIEVGTDNRVSVILRYQDERASLMELLASAGKAVAI